MLPSLLPEGCSSSSVEWRGWEVSEDVPSGVMVRVVLVSDSSRSAVTTDDVVADALADSATSIASAVPTTPAEPVSAELLSESE